MGKKTMFHFYLIRMVVLAFVLPLVLFIAMIKIGIDAKLSIMLCVGLFGYFMISISMKTIKMYSGKKKVKKLE